MALTTFEIFEDWLDTLSAPHYANPTYVEGASDQPVVFQARDELLEFTQLLEKETRRQVAVEIGVGRGGTHYLLRLLYDHVISIEMYPFTAGAFIGLMGTVDKSVWRGTGGLVIGDSRGKDLSEHISKAAEELDGIDVLFIDGDHSTDAVRSDHALYAPLVRPGGIIALHDAISKTTGVPAFLTELRRTQPLNLIIHSDHLGIAWYRKEPRDNV